jgi:hypothetical protein
MKEIFEAFLGLFFLLLLMVGGMSIIGAGIDARNADATKTGYVAELENSNFSASVLKGVLADAAGQGYDLKVDLYHQTPSGTRTMTQGITTSAGIPNTSDVYMAKLNLSFDYSFSMLNSVTPHELVGYAR